MASQLSNKSSVMAQLLASHKNSFTTLKKGEMVKGKITKISSNEILVDVGAKSEAMVLEKDKRMLRLILSLFKSGDTVEVNVLNPESESGQPVVSLRRYLGNIAWKKLEELEKSKEQIEVTVTEVAKAGYVVTTDFGISGFLPQSHTTVSQGQNVAAGSRIKVTVLELNRTDNKIIFSQKPAISEEDFKNTMEQVKVGQKVAAEITNVTPIGLFITFKLPKGGEREGFIHISETAWDKVDDLSGIYAAGQKIDVAINRFDTDARRINLSIKRLTKDPFEELVTALPVDKKVAGTVTKVEDGGISLVISSPVEEGEQVEAFIKKEKVPPGTTYTVDQKVTVLVSEHDKRRHRVIVTPVLLEKPLGYR